MSEASTASVSAPKAEPSCAEASEASAPKQTAPEPQTVGGKASEASAATFAEKQRKGGGLGAAVAALAEDGIRAGNVVTWIGATGKIVRFGRDGRPRKFGQIED